MRKHQIENAAFEVATQVRAVEDCIEHALSEIAELQGRMINARAVAGIGIATGHESLEYLASALQALVAARGGMAQCHRALAETKQVVPGLRHVTSFGDAEDCPPTKGVADLRVVA